MKKIAIFLAAILLLSCLFGCEQQPATNTNPSTSASDPTDPQQTQPQETEPQTTYPQGDYITNEDVDLRQIVVDYMYAMANVQWTAGPLLDYSSLGAKNLVYEPGKTYLGMVYNNNATGLEMFQSILDGTNRYIGTDTSWATSPGNSCATSVKHAWQQVSTTANFGYSADMMPCYKYSNVVAIGDLDWSLYDRTDTKTMIESHDKEVIFEAYAQMLPGDALVRHRGDAGGHALMLTKAPIVVRNADGTVNMVNSYLFLTDQNNNLNNTREYPSSWTVDAKVSFSTAWMEGYLPVTIAELRDGYTEMPTFGLSAAPTAQELAAGTLSGIVKSNHFLNVVRVDILSGDQTVATASAYPYEKTYKLQDLADALNLGALSAGTYTLCVYAEVGLGSETLLELEFTK